MRINIFSLNKKEDWGKVDRELYQVWCMHQSDVMLPKFLDTDFKKCFNYVRKKYGYKKICEKLELTN